MTVHRMLSECSMYFLDLLGDAATCKSSSIIIMTDWKDGVKDIGAQGLAEAKEDIATWPWYIKLGLPVGGVFLALVLIWSVFNGLWNKATAPSRVLDSSQMALVNKAAAATADGYAETMDGAVVRGNLLTCSNKDTDAKGTTGYGAVTCTARVPMVNGVGEARKVTMVERSMDCSIPEKGTTGCKLRPLAGSSTK